VLDVMRHTQTTTVPLANLEFSFGVEAGNQLVVLPLFGLTRIVARSLQRARFDTNLSRFLPHSVSVAISLAGVYYPGTALR
jgi:hypothetical protein